MTNKTRTKNLNNSQTKLTLFQKCQPSGLTSTAILTLFYSSQGLHPSAIARQLGCSRSNVSKVMKRLKNKGLLIQPKNGRRLTLNTGGGHFGKKSNSYVVPFDIRFRSLKWKLTHPVNLPYDESRVNNGVFQATWRIKNSTVRMNYGKNTYSIEIECGYTEGESIEEVYRKHDEEALNVYDWLCQHYPELAKVSVRLGYEVNRKGEVSIPQLKELAEKWLETHPRLNAGIFKIDDSLKNGGEFQINLNSFATQDDFEKLRAEICATNQNITKLSEILKELCDSLKTLLGGEEGGGNFPVKVKPEGVDYL